MKKTATTKQALVQAEKSPLRSSGAAGGTRASKRASNHPRFSAALDPAEVSPAKAAGTKAARIIEMLHQEAGATLPDLCFATGWQAHSVRGFLSATVKKRLGLNLISAPVAGENRRYRIEQAKGGTV